MSHGAAAAESLGRRGDSGHLKARASKSAAVRLLAGGEPLLLASYCCWRAAAAGEPLLPSALASRCCRCCRWRAAAAAAGELPLLPLASCRCCRWRAAAAAAEERPGRGCRRVPRTRLPKSARARLPKSARARLPEIAPASGSGRDYLQRPVTIEFDSRTRSYCNEAWCVGDRFARNGCRGRRSVMWYCGVQHSWTGLDRSANDAGWGARSGGSAGGRTVDRGC